jgi:cytochrome c-type biogenesis protein CcmE
MNKRSRRKVLIIAVLFGVTVATVLGLTAFQENLLYFYSPADVKAGKAPTNHTFRIGGLVIAGSVIREKDGLKVAFDLTDNTEVITVEYTGILPDLFREGQGIVAMGSLQKSGIFVAEEVLAKHDENYMPPEVADALKASEAQRKAAMPAGQL